MRKSLILLLALLILFGGVACAEEGITSIAQMNSPDVTVGVGQGSAAETIVRELLPEAEIAVYDDKPLAYLAVAQGKLDAFVYDYNQMRLAIEADIEGVHLLDEAMGEPVRIAVGISPVSTIPDFENRLNQFIAEVRADGTMDDMYRRWVLEGDENLPDIQLPENPTLQLTVGTTGIVPPYSYYIGTELSGYDIELARRFAAWLGADLQFKVYDYGAIIPAAMTGDVDCVMANLNITPERAEALPFSDVLFEDKLGVMVRGEAAENPEAHVSLEGKRIGVQTGTIADEVVQSAVEDIELSYYNAQVDIMMALQEGKVDGWCADEPIARYAVLSNEGMEILPVSLESSELAAVFAKTEEGQALRDQYSAFVDGLWADGTMAQIDSIWFGPDEEKRVVLDYEALPDTNGTLRMAVDTTFPPAVFMKDNRIVGYEVDIAARFCEANGYRLEIVPMNFDGLLPAVQSGKCDFAASCITVTEERAQSVLFSTPNYHSALVIVAMKEESTSSVSDAQPELASFADLKGKKVSFLSGAPFEELVRSKAPDVAECSYYNSMPDLVQALKSGKTDAFLMNNAVGELTINKNPELTLFPESLADSAFGIAFAKGDPRRDAWQEARDSLPKDQIEAAWKKWTGADESVKILPEQDWSGLNGTVHAAVCDTLEPMSYTGEGGAPMGFDVEIILMIARELDLRVEFTSMEFSAIMASVQAGKADLGAGSIIITDERAEAVDFVSYYPAAFELVVRAEKPQVEDASFWSGIASSFEKTFIREGRWRLFVDGVLTTLLITILTILLGTALGFAVFMLCRGGNPVANGVTRFCMWLVQGMPMVVLLMILYYIIFGSVAISGISVAVIGFTLTFGAAVYGLMKMGVGAVDNGQYEAAYALGYSNRRTFFKIILPQAIPHVLPAYKGEIVGLIKATAIVGYIAVQDLTKMGDIVRSRTYEAFFPLIAVTIIYFVLEGIIGFLIGRIGTNFNPKRRKPEDILKGVKNND